MDPVEPLDDEARELLASYRRDRPGPHGRARNWPAVHARVAATPTRVASRRHSSLWIGSIAFALAAAILLLVRALFGAWQAVQVQQVVPPAASDAVVAPEPAAVPVAREPIAPTTPALPAFPPTPPLVEAVPVQRPLAPARPSPPPRLEDTTREENELIAAAHGSLAVEDWAEALAALDEHARRFADGALAEERSALRTIALCRSHAEGAREARESFGSRYPGSHHHRSIKLACAERLDPGSP
jgi:hypothetical protein